MSGAYTAPPTRGEQDPDDGELSKMLRAAPELPSPGRALPPLPPPSGTSPAAKPGPMLAGIAASWPRLNPPAPKAKVFKRMIELVEAPLLAGARGALPKRVVKSVRY